MTSNLTLIFTDPATIKNFISKHNMAFDCCKDRFNKPYNLLILEIMDKYVCDVCDWVYDPAVGDPDNGIQPGTSFEDLPEDWVCPICGVGKDQFSKVD